MSAVMVFLHELHFNRRPAISLRSSIQSRANGLPIRAVDRLRKLISAFIESGEDLHLVLPNVTDEPRSQRARLVLESEKWSDVSMRERVDEHEA